MTKRLFSKQLLALLIRNIHVKNASEKSITFTDVFKRLFIRKNEAGLDFEL